MELPIFLWFIQCLKTLSSPNLCAALYKWVKMPFCFLNTSEFVSTALTWSGFLLIEFGPDKFRISVTPFLMLYTLLSRSFGFISLLNIFSPPVMILCFTLLLLFNVLLNMPGTEEVLLWLAGILLLLLSGSYVPAVAGMLLL